MSEAATSPPAAPPEPEKPKAKQTTYHVLRQLRAAVSPSQTEAWELVARSVPAASAEAAKRKVGNDLATTGEDAVVLVAVPSRSWVPQTAQVEIETRLILS